MSLPTWLLRDAAERWGTPLYVPDLDRAAANARAWRNALPGALVAFAVKANPDPALLSRLARDGFGFEGDVGLGRSIVTAAALTLVRTHGC